MDLLVSYREQVTIANFEEKLQFCPTNWEKHKTTEINEKLVNKGNTVM